MAVLPYYGGDADNNGGGTAAAKAAAAGIVLCACYAMSGTDVVYGGTSVKDSWDDDGSDDAGTNA
eukprot:3461629-Rhodomonas_salina.2